MQENSNKNKKSVLKQLALTEEMDERLEMVRGKYEKQNIPLTQQDVIRKMIMDHPEYQETAYQ